jgi:superfamily II DNA helicase RecQ
MDSTPDFRPQMQQLGALSTREVQMVFLTTTLPKHTEPELMRIMKIKTEEVQTFRGPTTQPKLEQYMAPAKIIVCGYHRADLGV